MMSNKQVGPFMGVSLGQIKTLEDGRWCCGTYDWQLGISEDLTISRNMLL
jgi:hypothetical protein